MPLANSTREMKYTVIKVPRANVGYRALGSGKYQIIVEPAFDARDQFKLALRDYHWDAVRGFLIKEVSEDALRKTVLAAVETVGLKNRNIFVSTKCPRWLSNALRRSLDRKDKGRKRMIAAVKKLKVRGCNLASRWSTKSLRRHLSEGV